MTKQGQEACPIARAASTIGDRWCLLIMRNALLGMRRFDHFKASLGIADNVLSARLARLVDAGVLVREPYRDGGRVRQHYRLTEAGLALHVVLEAMGQWGQQHAGGNGEPASAFEVWHTGGCGRVSAPGWVCTACGTSLAAADVSWRMPWLDEDPQPLASARS